jgi:hypothetical protein
LSRSGPYPWSVRAPSSKWFPLSKLCSGSLELAGPRTQSLPALFRPLSLSEYCPTWYLCGECVWSVGRRGPKVSCREYMRRRSQECCLCVLQPLEWGSPSPWTQGRSTSATWSRKPGSTKSLHHQLHTCSLCQVRFWWSPFPWRS